MTAAMKRSAILPVLLLPLLFLALSIAAGCRREDVRDFTVSIPGLTEADKTRIVEALQPYGGIRKDSYQWDFTAKTLSLRYDSMQIAQANILMAIEERGLKVEWPSPRQYAGHHKGE